MISKEGQKLNLASQKISEESKELDVYCQKYPNIIELDISNNNFKAFPKAFLQFQKLTTLDLRNNPFENVSLFTNISSFSLKKLSMSFLNIQI